MFLLVCHLDVVIDEGVSCYAEIETRMSLSDEKRLTITKKALAQCLYIGNTRICRIKAVLPPDCRVGWLKIYAGPRYVASVSITETSLYKFSKHLTSYIFGR